MSKPSILVRALGALLLAAGPAFADTPPVQQIVVAADLIRNPTVPFTTVIHITEYRNKKVADEGQITAFAKLNPQRGQYDSLVRIQEPTRDRGKLMLKNGNEIWFYDPATRAGMRISPQQRLLGQAANGDVVTVNLARDYESRLVGEETVSDGGRAERKTWHVDLRATSDQVTYPAISYWIERDTHRPVKAQFYADSGRLLKTAYYRRFEEQLGQVRPTETVIVDGVDSQLVTVLRYSEYRGREIPESWLTREGMSLARE